MVIVPFKVNGFDFVDQQELSAEDQKKVTLSIVDSLNLFPQEYHCEAVRPTHKEPVPQIRFGIYFRRDLVGALWLGCTQLAPGHTARAAKFFMRPCPGFIFEHVRTFWTAPVFALIVRHLLRNELDTRAGGTVQIEGLEYGLDARVVPVEFAEVHTLFNTLIGNDSTVNLEKRNLSQGGEDVRVVRSNGLP